jgi:hypothetical protein
LNLDFFIDVLVLVVAAAAAVAVADRSHQPTQPVVRKEEDNSQQRLFVLDSWYSWVDKDSQDTQPQDFHIHHHKQLHLIKTMFFD